MYKRALLPLAFLGSLIFPLAASAHEVYVLTAGQIATDVSEPPFDMISTALHDAHGFLFWGFVAALVIFCVFFISIIRPLERTLQPFLHRLKPYAPAIARVTVGLGFICSGYFGASFGPELPLVSTYGAYAPLASALLIVLGTLILVGFWARAAALVAFVMFSFTTYHHGSYMFTYANYFGEIVVLLILGSHKASVHSLTNTRDSFHRGYQAFVKKLEPYAFPLLRVCFGISLIYASAYAKIIHNNLALQVASLDFAGHTHSVAYYLGFEPHFLVLGAAIVEILIGLFFVFGIEIRFTSLFLLVWLSLSLWYFGEVVWPHIILIGIPIAFIFHGYDPYSLEGRVFDKGRREPVF